MRRVTLGIGITILTLAVSSTAHAHLMVEQHATLNVVNDGAYLVISVPVSAFSSVDDDGDGRLSTEELGKNLSSLQQQIHDNVKLIASSGQQLPLQGLMISLSPPHDDPGGPASYVIALGRFPVDDSVSAMAMEVLLQGKEPSQQTIHLTAKHDGTSRKFEFTPEQSRHLIFQSELAAIAPLILRQDKLHVVPVFDDQAIFQSKDIEHRVLVIAH